MGWIRCAAVAAAACAFWGQASAQTGPFEPSAFQSEVQGDLTQVLVLGTAHLSAAPDTFDPASLEPLLERLAAFQPDVIAIENLSGEQVQTLTTYAAGAYPGVATDYATRIMALMSAAHDATGLDIAAADAEVRATLPTLGAAPTPAARRRLAAVMMAAGDPMSALVQWWRLAPAERVAGPDFPDALVTGIEALAARRNESQWIGSRLAARRGLERVYPMDDHTSDDITNGYGEAAFHAVFDSPEFQASVGRPEFAFLAHAADFMRTPEETLETYRRLNADIVGHQDARGQWLPLLASAYPGDLGRKIIAGWETRNLRMAANIREAAGAAPGGRVLVIVGNAHKAWLEAYFRQMSDMRVVDATDILR